MQFAVESKRLAKKLTTKNTIIHSTPSITLIVYVQEVAKYLIAARSEVRRGVRQQEAPVSEQRQPLHQRIFAVQTHALVPSGQTVWSRLVLSSHRTQETQVDPGWRTTPNKAAAEAVVHTRYSRFRFFARRGGDDGA